MNRDQGLSQPTPASISHQDWSLHRKGIIDSDRHQELVQQARRRGMRDYIKRLPNIVRSDGTDIVRVDVIEERVLHKFKFDESTAVGSGQGDGNSKVGDIIISEEQIPQGAQVHDEFTVNDYLNRLFTDLELPTTNRASNATLDTQEVRFTDVRKVGPLANLDKRRTLKENIKRNAAAGNPHVGGVRNEDLRFKIWEVSKSTVNAVVPIIMDVSPSMGPKEKEAARTFCYYLVKFLETKYPQVKTIFIAHDGEVAQPDPKDFFTLAHVAGGGTDIPLAFETTVKLLEDYPPEDYDVFPVYIGDGEDTNGDYGRFSKAAVELAKRSTQLSYVETIDLNDVNRVPTTPPPYLSDILHNISRQSDLAGRIAKENLPSADEAEDTLRAFFPRGGRRAA